MYIGIKGAERLDRSDDSLGLLRAHGEAIKMHRNRKDMHDIKLQTGWELGIDKKWRYETIDPFHTTAELEDHIKRHFGEPVNIEYCMNDMTLLTAYPAFNELRLFGLYHPTKKFSGYFDPRRYAMVVCMGTANDPFDYQTEGVLLHEVQHLIQEEEDFARGGDISIGRRKYMRLAGEVEARNVCARHLLTDSQRSIQLRTDTQDVIDGMQIIKFI